MDLFSVRSSLKYPPVVRFSQIIGEAAVVVAVAGVFVLLFD